MKQIIITLQKNEKDPVFYHYSTMFQGILMNAVDTVYAEELHKNMLHPYSQYVQWDNHFLYWTLNCLTEEFWQNIKFYYKTVTSISLKDKEYPVVEKQLNEISIDQLISRYCFGNNSNTVHIEFLTPTSFRQGDNYLIFPTCEMFFQSLLKKFELASEDNQIYSEELVNDFSEFSEITNYKLRTSYFRMKNIKIPAFVGQITIKVNGTPQLVNMGHMLAKYGEFSGVGIKSSMGMGAMRRIMND